MACMPMTLATILDREGVAVRAGHHCAQVLMERFGVASTSRASFALYNNRADVDALIAGLHKARGIPGRWITRSGNCIGTDPGSRRTIRAITAP